MPIFEWDELKEKSNFRKHEVTFDEGESVFYDPSSLTIPDPDHSVEEERFIDIGNSNKNRILVVVTRKEKIGSGSSASAKPIKRSVKCMSKKTEEIRDEYDFSKGVRGKHAKSLAHGHTTIIHKSDGSTTIRESRPIILEPDLQMRFPNSQAVNKALRSLLEQSKT